MVLLMTRDKLYQGILAMFPNAVSVNISVTSEGMDINVNYKSPTTGASRRDIQGNWVDKVSPAKEKEEGKTFMPLCNVLKAYDGRVVS